MLGKALPYRSEERRSERTGVLAQVVESGMEAGTFVAMNNRVSQSVPHFHVHIVPRRHKDGLKGFFWPRHPYKSDEEADLAQTAIRQAVSKLSK